MSRWSQLFVLSLILVAAGAKVQAATGNRILLSGTVLGFDQRVVRIQTSDGVLRVPRLGIQDDDHLRPGKIAYALVSLQELYQLN